MSTSEQPPVVQPSSTEAKPTVKKVNGSSDEKAPDSSENGLQKPKSSKGKKRKKPKDATAPRYPLSGYIRYLNDRRENVRTENPNLSFAELTKILAGEWSSLPADKKQQYLDAAEQDKERYSKEYNAYKQTEAYRIFTKQQNEKKMKESKEETKANSLSRPNSAAKEFSHSEMDFANGNFDIPIFTEEFLDHNKTRDAELRQLRKSNTDYEQQNATLQKHIETVKGAIAKLEEEIVQQRKSNTSLQAHLDGLRRALINGFGTIKIAGLPETPSFASIDAYMNKLHANLSESNTQDQEMMNSVRDAVKRLEFEA